MTGKKNILIIDDLHPVFFENMDTRYFNINYQPEILPIQIQEKLKDVQILILRSKVIVDENLCKYADKLELVARAGSGVDNIDTEWLENNGINIINTPEANRTSVAEQAVGMILSLMANIVKSDREIHQKKWDRPGNRGDELRGKTIGIIGFGNTGSELAKVISGFGVNIIAYDKYKSGFGSNFVSEVEMNEVFKQTDILSLHIPLTKETTNLVNEEFINRFVKPIKLINTSRGEIVNTNDLINAIESKKINGFATDVLENEKINDLNKKQQKEFNKLCSFDNVIITPHVAGWTNESYKKISENLAEKINEFCKIDKKNDRFKVQKI